MDCVEISYLDTRSLWNDANSFQFALGFLPDNVQKRIAKLKFIGDAKMSLASHILQRYVVWKFIDKYEADKARSLKDIQFKSGKFGRPYYLSSDKCNFIIDFNISTVSGRVIIAHIIRRKTRVADGGDYPLVGIDLTDPPSLQSHEWLHDFAPMVSTQNELLAIREASNVGFDGLDSSLFSAISLAIRWAIKESYIKGIGAGLVGSIDISTVEADGESNTTIDKVVIEEYLNQANRVITGDPVNPARFFPIEKLLVSSVEDTCWKARIFTFDGIISAITLHKDIYVPGKHEPELLLSALSWKDIKNELIA